MKNYIEEYYQQIAGGSTIAGKWICLWYQYIVEGLKEKRFFYSQKKADAVILFMESFLHHHEGALAPGLVKLELWQKAMLAVIFGILDGDGNRQFREVIALLARKNGKTLLAAGIAEYMTFLDDYGARVYFAASKLEQANLCFNAYLQSLSQEAELNAMTRKRRTDIYVEANNATAKPIAFAAKKSEGLNISCVICDELASWRGATGLRFYETLKSSGGARRQPLYLSITTAGYESDGIFDEMIRRGTRVLLGGSREARLAPFLYMIDDPAKWDHMNELKKSNPNLGVSVTEEYLREEIAIAEGSLSKKAEFLTKYCNIKQNSSLAWLDAEVVRKMSGAELNLEDFRGCYCVGGVDLSQTTDLTAAVILIERPRRTVKEKELEGKGKFQKAGQEIEENQNAETAQELPERETGDLYVFAKFWLPAAKLEKAAERDGLPYAIYVQRGLLELSGENYVDYRDCFNWFVSLVQNYEILPLKIGYDRYSAQYLVQELNAASFHTDDVYQGDNLWGVLQEMEGLFKDGRVNIGDNDLLKVHLLNAAIKMSVERGRGRLVKIDPSAHIDGTAALTDAFTVRQKWMNSIGAQLSNDWILDKVKSVP